MCNRFLKFIPSEEALYLLKNKGHAFRLLTIIAESARRYEGGPDGLDIGEAFIGGHKKYDMSERNYRTAKEILIARRHMKIMETSRTRKKSTNGTTTVGTKVKLLSSNVWDINFQVTDERTNERPTNDRRMTDDKLEEREEYKERKEDMIIAQSAPRPRKKNSDPLSFDFQNWRFIGITNEDAAEWKMLYPHIDLVVEVAKAANWLKSNPTKNNKKLWRKFLTGWFGRSNESIENKKAFRSAGSANGQDRRTKNIDGTPIQSRAEGLF